MKTTLVLAVAVLVLFAPMVGATRVEAGGLGDFFNGNSPVERIIGAAGTGAAVSVVYNAVLGKKHGAPIGKAALAGAAAGATLQTILEVTDNVPISCGRDEVYRDPRTGQIYCGDQGQQVAYPQYPVQSYTPPVIVVRDGGYGHGGGWYGDRGGCRGCEFEYRRQYNSWYAAGESARRNDHFQRQEESRRLDEIRSERAGNRGRLDGFEDGRRHRGRR